MTEASAFLVGMLYPNAFHVTTCTFHKNSRSNGNLVKLIWIYAKKCAVKAIAKEQRNAGQHATISWHSYSQKCIFIQWLAWMNLALMAELRLGMLKLQTNANLHVFSLW